MWDSGDRLSGLTRKDWRGENTGHDNHKQIRVRLIIVTSWAQTKSTGNEANDLAPVVWEPGDGEGHADKRDQAHGGGAHHPIHTGQQPHPHPGKVKNIKLQLGLKLILRNLNVILRLMFWWPVPGVEVSEGGPGEHRGEAEHEGGQGQAGPGTKGRHNDQTSWSQKLASSIKQIETNWNHSDSLQRSENPHPAANWTPKPVHQQTLSLQHPHLSLRHQSPNKISLGLDKVTL